MKRGAWWPAILLSVALLVIIVPVEVMAPRPLPSLILTAAACICGGLGWRYPAVAGGALVLLNLTVVLAGYNPSLAALTGLIPILSATLSRSAWGLWINLVGQFAVNGFFVLPSAKNPYQVMLGVISLMMLLLPPYLVGRLVLYLVDRAERMRALQEQRMAEERRQLARDLHDTIVYATTTMVMRSEELRRREDLPPGVHDELVQIAKTGRNATRGLRDLLSLLRQSGDIATTIRTIEPGELGPVLDGQLEKLRAAGFDAKAHVSGDLTTLSADSSSVLGALMVESSSNIVKHGRRDAPCSVFVEVGDGDVELAVVNGVLPHEVEREHEPMGIIGMSERVADIGGEFSAGRTGDSFLVEAKLAR